jgi:N-acetyl-anhydromuramyl-L-alanine amidase AmpD
LLAIYVLSQLTVLSNRLTQVVQELAITPLDDAVGHDQLQPDRQVDDG